MIATLPEIYAALDSEIAPLVLALREDGFQTRHSCAGHGKMKPWVVIGFRADILMEAQRLVLWCRERRIAARVMIKVGDSRIRTAAEMDGTPAFPHIRLELD